MNKENKVFSQNLLSPLGMGAKNEERPHRQSVSEMGMGLRDWVCSRRMGGEDL